MTEHDPTGRDQHEPGAKLDAGKPRPALVLGGFSRALAAVTEVGTFGAAKYTDNGWRSVPDGMQRYTDAMLRHWLADPGGLSPDPDSGLAHAAHLAWNALARLELMLAEKRRHELEEMVEAVLRPPGWAGRDQHEPGGTVREIVDALILEAMRRGESILKKEGQRHPFRCDPA